MVLRRLGRQEFHAPLIGLFDEHGGLLDAGDLREGVEAAEAVGDDAITGSNRQENFTHGTSQQRVRWFGVGFDTGEYRSCDTFSQDYGSL